MSGLALVHLVRAQNGPGPLRAFLDSYHARPAGIDHELVMLCKGFERPHCEQPDRATLAALLGTSGGRVIAVSDHGFDLTAYWKALRGVEHERLCFVNSHSVIQSAGWLSHLSRALDGGKVGMSGASGSWASRVSLLLYQLGLPSPYRVFGGRQSMRTAFLELQGKRYRGDLPHALTLPYEAVRTIGFSRFPAYHLRTNAWMIERSTMLQLKVGRLASKEAVYRLESSRRSVTSQVWALGLQALVVGRDGQAYPPDRWDESFTFWQGGQQNLLVADNQTRAYAEASAAQRRLLATFAWGPRARATGGTSLT